jgi:hypothetical protein
MTPTTEPQSTVIPIAGWRLTGIGLLRITFGLVWAIDAWFKWQPNFINNFTNYLTGAQQDQPAWVQSWIGFWIDVVNVDPMSSPTWSRSARPPLQSGSSSGC